MDWVDLHLEPNEASDLCPLDEPGLLAAREWDLAYVTVLDEATVERSIAVLGHALGAPVAEGWSSHRLELSSDASGPTEDAEACALRNGKVYVVGSHYGSKDGPLQPRRAFLARFDTAEVAGGLDGAQPRLQIARNRFLLHRAVNDALATTGVDLLPRGERVRECFIDATIRRGEKKGKRWAGRVRADDHPINVEAAAFRPDGTLLLGLRHPCTAAGDPLLVEIEDVDVLLGDEEAEPRCHSVWTLPGTGSPDEPVGVRALHTDGGDEYHAVVGNLDSLDKGSLLLEDHPAGGAARSSHVRFALPAGPRGGLAQELSEVHVFDDLRTVEGLATTPDGDVLYVVDQDDRVQLGFLAVA